MALCISFFPSFWLVISCIALIILLIVLFSSEIVGMSAEMRADTPDGAVSAWMGRSEGGPDGVGTVGWS